jgi:putative ABC transport system substrate-binding protein
MLALMLLVGPGGARPRVAFLTLGDQQMDAVLIAAFVEGLRRLGYAEGRNLDIDYRYTAGDVERLKQLAQELVALHPDVLVGSEPSAARALKNVAPTLPIVCIALTDALIPDLIASYARPAT